MHETTPSTGRTAVITGSASGLGSVVAHRLASAGCAVVIHGGDAETVAATARRIAADTEARVLESTADLRDPEAITGLVAETAERLGPIDIVVANSVVRRSGPIETWTAADWDESLAVNLSSMFHLARLAIPGMRERRWGRLLAMSSVYGSRGEVDRVGYVTTKTALLGLVRAIALETAGAGITCNAISPGAVTTPPVLARFDELARSSGRSAEDIARDYVAERHPTGEFVPAEDVAELVAHLCGPHSGSITGSVLPIDGGWSAR